MRYVRQRDKYSCGAVALLNMWKWLGKEYTYKDLKKIKKQCNCKIKHDFFSVVSNKPYKGTHPSDIDLYIQKNKIKHKYRDKPAIMHLYDHIDAGGIALIRAIYKNTNHIYGHYYLCIDYDGEFFHVVNYYDNETISFLNWDDMEDEFQHNGSLMWLINK